ncbi:hypothetical protein BDZ45DRAFT_319438 [Acephala macrosclerotiorum]|nr:hypothetical protein BDZ45DRAFT_319438 [Acephala macrosclerotiorum]
MSASDHQLTLAEIPYKGMLSTRFMLTKDGPKILSYDVAGTAIETLTVMRLFSKKTDLAEIMLACIDGRLGEVQERLQTEEDKLASCTVVLGGSKPLDPQNPEPDPIVISDKDVHKKVRGTCFPLLEREEWNQANRILLLDVVRFYHMDTKIFLDPNAKQSNANADPNTDTQARPNVTRIQQSGRGTPRSPPRPLHKETIATGPNIIAISAPASSLNEAIHKAAFAAKYVTYQGKIPMTDHACL